MAMYVREMNYILGLDIAIQINSLLEDQDCSTIAAMKRICNNNFNAELVDEGSKVLYDEVDQVILSKIQDSYEVYQITYKSFIDSHDEFIRTVISRRIIKLVNKIDRFTLLMRMAPALHRKTRTIYRTVMIDIITYIERFERQQRSSSELENDQFQYYP